MNDAELAALLAAEAGRLLVKLRADLIAKGLTGKALGIEGDRAANRLLCDRIAAERPDDGLLSEEEKDSADRLNRSRVWIIDPVDGTREFGEERADWAVHVALAINGQATVGAVALPGHGPDGLVLRSDAPRTLAREQSPPRMLVSRTRPAAEALSVAEALGAELVPMGSAGAKAMAVVLGDAEIYLHSGGQYEWDNCAPVAVAQAHGLHCSRIDGRPLIYNQADVYVPDLLICRQHWARPVLDLISSNIASA